MQVKFKFGPFCHLKTAHFSESVTGAVSVLTYVILFLLTQMPRINQPRQPEMKQVKRKLFCMKQANIFVFFGLFWSSSF